MTELKYIVADKIRRVSSLYCLVIGHQIKWSRPAPGTLPWLGACDCGAMFIDAGPGATRVTAARFIKHIAARTKDGEHT